MIFDLKANLGGRLIGNQLKKFIFAPDCTETYNIINTSINLLMKNLHFKFMAICMSVMIAGLFVGCGPDNVTPVEPDDPEVEKPGPGPAVDPNVGDFALEVKSVAADCVELLVTAPAEVEIAYQVVSEETLISPAVLFKDTKNSTFVTVTPGQTLKVTANVEQDATQYLYAAAKLNDKNYSALVTVEFTTPAYEFDELITIVDTYLDGYKAHITFPQETLEREHAIRVASMPLAWYNFMTSTQGTDAIDLQAIASQGDPYRGHLFRDSTIVWNDDNVVLLDKFGDPVIDENGEMYDIHEPMAPGEPTIIFAGECRYGSKEDFADVVGYYQPERDSWSVPYYDRANRKWLGAFQKKTFFTKEPTLCDATVTVDIPEDEIEVTDAMVYFTMDEGVSRYFYMILDNSTYNQLLGTYLDGHEEWFQWFLTSYIAFFEWGIYPLTEDHSVNAAAGFVEPLTGGETYHVLVTVMGDDRGATQRFIHKTFTAKEKTKRAPVIDVKAVENGDPYLATFNIKAPNKDVVGAYWACNYAREFELMFNAKYTYADILKGNYSFTSEEIAQINSDEGLEVSSPTLDGEVTRFAVYGCNDEYTFNYVDDEKEGAGWADYHAPMAEKKAPVNSPLLETLQGEWTATATIMAKEKLEDDSVVSYNVEHSSKIVISSAAPEVPAYLDESVYDLYPKKTKDDVDGMFEELGDLTDQFTEYRLEGQNRLLCNGFIDFDYYKNPGRLTYRTPYDLFVATNYNSLDVPMIMNDFGPKWFMEVLADGSVIVPFDSMYLPPMHRWPGYPFYVGAVSGEYAVIDATKEVPGFPVEVSADGNTITIKPIVAGGQNCYMNAVGNAPDGLEIIASVISEIVLTRGWTEPEQPEAVPAAAPARLKAVTFDGKPVSKLPKQKIIKSMTDLEAAPRREYKADETPNVVTREMVDATSAKIINHFNVR